MLARRQYAHAYKNASLNIWDTGANRGNFVSLKYARTGTVRDNHVKMSTAAGLYQPPKTFDAVISVGWGAEGLGTPIPCLHGYGIIGGRWDGAAARSTHGNMVS